MTSPTGTPPPLLPGVLRLAITYDFGGGYGVNVLHFKCHETGGLGSSDVSDMVTALGHFWRDDLWKIDASNEWVVSLYKAVYAKIEGQPDVKRVTIGDATAGTGTTAADYANLAYLINWDTGDQRRGGKPRSYLPGVVEASNADYANLDSTFVSDKNSHIATFLGHVAGATHGSLVCDNLIDYSTVNNGAYRSAGAFWAITTGHCNPVIGTQRRRVGRARS